MKNMKRYASKQKISQEAVDAPDVEALVSSFQKEFPGLLEWGQLMADKVEARTVEDLQS